MNQKMTDFDKANKHVEILAQVSFKNKVNIFLIKILFVCVLFVEKNYPIF